MLVRVLTATTLVLVALHPASAQSHIRLSGATNLADLNGFLFSYDNIFGYTSGTVSVGPVGGFVQAGDITLFARSAAQGRFSSTDMLGISSSSFIDNPTNNGPLFITTRTAAAFRDTLTWVGSDPPPLSLRFEYEVHGSLLASANGVNFANSSFTFFAGESAANESTGPQATGSITFSNGNFSNGAWNVFDSGINTQGVFTNVAHGSGADGDSFISNFYIDYLRQSNTNNYDIALTIGAVTHVGVTSNSSVSAVANLLNTAILNKITLSDGTLVTPDQVRFSDGFVYAPTSVQSVPAPPAVVMGAVGGLSLIGYSVRLRRRKCNDPTGCSHGIVA